MSTVPIELPLRASDAAALADLIIQQVEGRTLTEDLRNRLAGQSARLGLSSLEPMLGSLQRDPVHSSSYYVVVDTGPAGATRTFLLRLALSTAPATALFTDSILIGRMRPGGGREIVVNAIPFAAADREKIETFAGQVDRAFLPRPLGAQPGIAVDCRQPEIALPAAFEAFRSWRTAGRNLAGTVTLGAGGYGAALWAAIRAGWREGYSIEAAGMAAAGPEVAGFTRFCADARSIGASADGGSWAAEEFSRPFALGHATYTFEADEIRRLVARYGGALAAAEGLFEQIQEMKSRQTSWKHFDFGIRLGESGAPAQPKDLLFWLHWLKARGRVAQVASLHCDAQDTGELAQVARHYGAIASVRWAVGHSEAVLAQIGKATNGRIHYETGAELELQLFEVLAEQPPTSQWRKLYDRMLARVPGGGPAVLGDSDLGRANGNAFLISCLGEVAGQRDTGWPGGDERSFRQRLAGLPAELGREARKRNLRHLLWLSDVLRG